ncbi:hypothetical protein AMATHDRAFT_144574 [Amanita thiersii Skay4041]|uniref:JmjC domain-containing protein n=1 Tax=Amanita thiersii Skay4041 TaxID=703135 RepID=A0A2A9NQZ9_9AGAR|nr:hypothetical protein AMATHDRAFT_144574 [Amanita thiersii Skay4041]
MSHTQSSYQWRQLHTDACIVKSLLLLDAGNASDAVSSLDYAIIISGATGNDRLHIIHTLIQGIQFRHLPLPAFSLQKYPGTNSTGYIKPLHTAEHCIVPLDHPPSLLTFQTKLFREPFVLRNYASGWPAFEEHPWCSVGYLRSISGLGRIVPVEVGNDYRSNEWSQKLIDWDEFLSSLDFIDQPRQKDTDIMYLAQHNLFMQFPKLWEDIFIPDYVYADLDCPRHTRPENDEGLVINTWLGPRGTMSPAHTDPYHNIYVQIVGSKTVWLAAPELSAYMYPYTGREGAGHPAVNELQPEMSNTTRIDVFGEKSGESEQEFPGFWKEVVGQAKWYTLEAGDALYIPGGWWHGMRSEETSFSVSMWF